MKHILPLCFTVIALCACCQSQDSDSGDIYKKVSADTMLFITNDTIDGIPFIKMQINNDAAYISMADSVIPSLDDSTIALCVGAAFTGELLPDFKTTNVAGDYVIDGMLHKGYDCDANTGFLYADKKIFTISSLDNRKEWTDNAVKNGGTLFEQMMIVKNGKNSYPGKPIKPQVSDIYRSVCIMNDGNFAVIQSLDSVSLGNYISSLIKLGVSDALYLDMGRGWNYGWYRETAASDETVLFDYRTPYQTNWLVIRKK